MWTYGKHPAVKVKEDYRWPQNGEPEWRFRVWKWSDNNVPLLSDGREYYLASLWYCGESVPPPVVRTAAPVLNSNKQVCFVLPFFIERTRYYDAAARKAR